MAEPKKLQVYLDNCSFNRPFDDQMQLKIILETEAKQFIQRQILTGIYELVWSYVLEHENNQNPFEDKRTSIEEWKQIAQIHCIENNYIITKAQELQKIGLKPMDALHTACAVYAKCDYLITTDKPFYNKNAKVHEIQIVNPVTFIELEVN